jgi:CspA family cold shock protein
VKFWNENRGFGFVVQDEGGEDLFMHRYGLRDREWRPEMNDRVEFDIGHGPDGRLRAAGVKPID